MIDGYLIHKQEGIPGRNKIIILTTTPEFIWFIVTIIALYKLEFENKYIWLPLVFVFYNMTGWVYSLYLAHEVKADVDNFNSS